MGKSLRHCRTTSYPQNDTALVLASLRRPPLLASSVSARVSPHAPCGPNKLGDATSPASASPSPPQSLSHFSFRNIAAAFGDVQRAQRNLAVISRHRYGTRIMAQYRRRCRRASGGPISVNFSSWTNKPHRCAVRGQEPLTMVWDDGNQILCHRSEVQRCTQ